MFATIVFAVANKIKNVYAFLFRHKRFILFATACAGVRGCSYGAVEARRKGRVLTSDSPPCLHWLVLAILHNVIVVFF
jgi:hypothetical protein